MKKEHFLLKNPLVLFLPFLVLYAFIVIRLHTDEMLGDESRYYGYAQNMLQGFYSPPPPDIDLWSGPGYSIILIPFVALGLPLICITLLNAVFQYLSVVLLFKTLRVYLSGKASLMVSVLWGGYFIAYQELPCILTEPLTIFLFTLLAYSLVKAFENNDRVYTIISGFLIGYIALTKIIFGYALLILLAGVILLWLINRKSEQLRKSTLLMIVAFGTTIPYLAYTYSLTGRIFYWGNSGGSSLYWMSTPFEGEYGEWNNDTFTANCGNIPGMPCNSELYKANHQKFFEEVNKYRGVERDDALKRIAINNIKGNPGKFVNNWIANIGRLLFGMPSSYFYQRVENLYRIFPNAILLSFIVLAMFPTILRWRRISFPIRFILIFVGIYLAGSSLVSAYPRQFYIIVPILLLWISYILNKTVSINLNFTSNEKPDGSKA